MNYRIMWQIKTAVISNVDNDCIVRVFVVVVVVALSVWILALVSLHISFCSLYLFIVKNAITNG